MKNDKEMASTLLDQPSAPRRRGRRWLLVGGLAFALMLALAVGALIGSSTGTTQAAALASSSASNSQTQAVAQGVSNDPQTLVVAPGSANNTQTFAATPGARGQCEALTVSSVNGTKIVAKTSSGSSVTIHTTASTRYTQAGRLSQQAPSRLALALTSWGRTTATGALLPQASTSVDCVPPPNSDEITPISNR